MGASLVGVLAAFVIIGLHLLPKEFPQALVLLAQVVDGLDQCLLLPSPEVILIALSGEASIVSFEIFNLICQLSNLFLVLQTISPLAAEADPIAV